MNPPLCQLSDEDLVRLCLEYGDRDERPLVEILRRHGSLVWSVCYRFTGDAQDAEDLMQETFFKVYRNLHRFRGASSFRTWLFQIALNTARNELRRRSRRPAVSDVPLDAWSETLGADVTVEQAWDEHILRPGLENAWSGLRPDQQELLRLKDLEGRSYAEIAGLMGVALSACKMRVQRARLAFQMIYRHEESEGS